MRILNYNELAAVCGGTNPPPPSSVDGSQTITVTAGPVSYTGSANNFAAGWAGFKNAMAQAGLLATQAITLEEAGLACDFYSSWSVCTAAQGQVDFIMGQSAGGGGGGGGAAGGGSGGGVPAPSDPGTGVGRFPGDPYGDPISGNN